MLAVDVIEISIEECTRIWPSLAFRCWGQSWQEPSHLEDLQDFCAKAAGHRSVCLVAIANGQDVGYLAACEDELARCFVHEGAVLPASRRQGVFSALLSKLEGWAHDHHIRQIGTTVNPRNSAMIRCLSKAGFRKAGAPSPDTLEMAKALAT